ncbi:MAG: N-acetyltransferase family protein [Treponema sp.]|nr:N-acetyltransferase family protein [Treponema sp.]
MKQFTLRPATPDDAAAILKIYEPYVKNTAITFEYDVPSLEEFTQRITNTLKKYPYFVAETDNKIVGYAYAGPLKTRMAYSWSVELSVYVDKEYHGQGIGKVLYTKLEEILKKMNISNLYACIAYTDEDNEYLTQGSPKFHEKMGFKINGKFTKCAYKFGRWFDMIWMEKPIADHIPNQPNMIPFPEIK